MLDYYTWKELRKITKLLRIMEIRQVAPKPEPRRKDMPLTYEEVNMLVNAMNSYHERYLKKIQRIVTPRTKKESMELGARQELFQRLAMFRHTYELEPEEGHPDYPENVNQP
jgi:hypothetical protein